MTMYNFLRSNSDSYTICYLDYYQSIIYIYSKYIHIYVQYLKNIQKFRTFSFIRAGILHSFLAKRCLFLIDEDWHHKYGYK